LECGRLLPLFKLPAKSHKPEKTSF